MSRRRKLRAAPAPVSYMLHDGFGQLLWRDDTNKPDHRPRVLCAPDVFDRVNKAVEDAGQSGAYKVLRSRFVRRGQVCLTGSAVPDSSVGPLRHLTATETNQWLISLMPIDMEAS